MKVWRVFKYIILTTLLASGIFIAIVAYQFYDRMCWFGIEDGISHGYEDLISWIEGYVENHNKPPETLSDAPDWAMEDIQEINEIVRTGYYLIPERDAWKLDVLVRARGKERQFIYVSDGKLTPEEESRYYVWCHDWIVLRMP